MRERDVEQYLVEQVKAKGGEVRKVKWIGRNGAPDRIVMLPDRTIWVELKAPGEKCRPHQIREHERMRRMGQRVEVVDSFEGVDEVLA
ncbi:PDDEXK family nuclease [Hydrogenophaga aquatica]